MFTVHHRLERVEFVFWFLCCGQPFILVTCTHVHVATSTIDADQPDKNRSARFSFVCWRVHVNISHEARTRNIHLKLYLYSIYLSPSSFFNSIFFFYPPFIWCVHRTMVCWKFGPVHSESRLVFKRNLYA